MNIFMYLMIKLWNNLVRLKYLMKPYKLNKKSRKKIYNRSKRKNIIIKIQHPICSAYSKNHSKLTELIHKKML